VHLVFWRSNCSMKSSTSYPTVENLNLMIMENIKKIARGRENEWRLRFHVVRHSAYIDKATSLLIFSLYDILDEYNVL
jgi:hypothetical protein